MVGRDQQPSQWRKVLPKFGPCLRAGTRRVDASTGVEAGTWAAPALKGQDGSVPGLPAARVPPPCHTTRADAPRAREALDEPRASKAEYRTSRARIQIQAWLRLKPVGTRATLARNRFLK